MSSREALRVRIDTSDLAQNQNCHLSGCSNELPTDDKLFGKGTVRADGRKIHPLCLVEVKTPAESKGPWDYFKVRATIPAEEAFRPLAEGGCS
jgi:hypothetical protein